MLDDGWGGFTTFFLIFLIKIFIFMCVYTNLFLVDIIHMYLYKIFL